MTRRSEPGSRLAELADAHLASKTSREFSETLSDLWRQMATEGPSKEAKTIRSERFRRRSQERLADIARSEISAATNDDRRSKAVERIRQAWIDSYFSPVSLDRILGELSTTDQALPVLYRDREYLDLRRRYFELRIENVYRRQDGLAKRLVGYCRGAGYELDELQEYLNWVDLEVVRRIPG